MLTVGRCGVNYIGFCCRFDLGILMELIAGSLRWCTYHFFWTLGIMWICCGQVFVNISSSYNLVPRLVDFGGPN